MRQRSFEECQCWGWTCFSLGVQSESPVVCLIVSLPHISHKYIQVSVFLYNFLSCSQTHTTHFNVHANKDQRAQVKKKKTSQSLFWSWLRVRRSDHQRLKSLRHHCAWLCWWRRSRRWTGGEWKSIKEAHFEAAGRPDSGSAWIEWWCK